MRGSTIKRIGGSVVVAAALAAAAAGPATAMVAPACSTRLAAAEVGTSASCSFDTPYDWAAITLKPVGTVTASLRCVTSYGSVYETSRTVADTTNWITRSPGYCTLTLTSASSGTTAFGSAVPMTPPFYPVP
jgi:hypothetical protein